MKITLTCLQRLNIEALIHARELKTLDEQFVTYELLTNIRMSRAEKQRLFLPRPDGTTLPDDNAIELEPSVVREMPDSQVEELKKLLTTAKVRVADVEWLLPLKRQLESSVAAPLTDVKKQKVS